MLKGPIIPMEPISKKEPFDSPAHTFEVKWDGVRMLAFCGDTIRLQNRHLHDRTCEYPELGLLKQILGNHDAILDGEIIALKDGKPSFHLVMQRDRNRAPDKRAISSIPVNYMVFDLLFVDGRSIMQEPLDCRKARLEDLLCATGDPVHVVTGFHRDGHALYEATKKREMEGIVAKELNSAYVPASKTERWIKIKHRKRQDCVVGGYVRGAGGTVSILAGAYSEGAFLYIGSVSSGLKSDEGEIIMVELKDTAITRPVFSNPPVIRNAVWVTPALTFICEFLEWTDDLKMRSPSLMGFSIKPASECTVV